MTAREVQGLVPADVFPPPSASPPPIPKDSRMPPLLETVYQPSGPQVRPWVRYWARMTDYLIFCLLCGIIVAIIYEPLLDIRKLLGIIMFFLYIFVEPIMLSSWGTTPGKALLRIRLRRRDGTKLNYSEGLNRSFKVWLRGWGLGIPIVAFFTLITAHMRLTREGKTSWDQEGQFIVHHQIVSPLRTIVTVLIFIAFSALVVIGKMRN